jgi:hypothetical protein
MGLHDQDRGKPASEEDDIGIGREGVEVAPVQKPLFEDTRPNSEEAERSRRRVLVDRMMFCYGAGQVKRWHTRDYMIREESVAAHSWNVAMWIMLLHPEPGKALVHAALVHDVAEKMTGDMPRWAKQDPAVGGLFDELEYKVLESKGLQFDLEEDDLVWLKAVDCFDAWMFLRQNVLAGNKLALDGYTRTTAELNSLKLPAPLQEAYDAIRWGDKL